MKNYEYLKKVSMSVVSLLLILIMIAMIGYRDVKPQQKSIVDKLGQLSVSGNKIIDKNGEPVALRGMSLFWSQINGKYYNYDCVKWLRDDWKCTIVRAAMGIEEADGLDAEVLGLA